MKTLKRDSIDFYKNKPWNSIDEYHALVLKHHLTGDDLEKELKRLEKLEIPLPDIRPPRKPNT